MRTDWILFWMLYNFWVLHPSLFIDIFPSSFFWRMSWVVCEIGFIFFASSLMMFSVVSLCMGIVFQWNLVFSILIVVVIWLSFIMTETCSIVEAFVIGCSGKNIHLYSFRKGRGSDLSSTCESLQSFWLNFSRKIIKVSYNFFFIFSELITQFLLLFLYPLIEIRDEMIEIVLSFELGFRNLMSTDWTH